MTQQQIGYINAQTSQKRLEYEKMNAEAAKLQAETAREKQNFYQNTEFWWGLGTGAAATVGGLLVLALI